VGYLTLDDKGLIREANKTVQDLLGLAADQLRGTPFSRHVAGQSAQAFSLHLKKVIESGRPDSCELRLALPDGRDVPVRIDSICLTDAQGRISCRLALTDSTGRTLSERRLAESEAMFRQLVTGIREVFWLMDEQFRVLYVSPAYADLFGRSTASLYADTFSWLKIVHQEDLARVQAAIEDFKGSGRFDLEYRIVRPDGVRWVHARVNPVDAIEGPARYAGLVEDITERKEAEELSRSLASFPEQNPHPVLRFDRNATLLYANEASRPLRDAFGWSVGQVATAFPSDIEQAIKDAQRLDREVALDGRAYLLSVTPFPDSGYVNLYGMDVTGLKAAEAALAAARDRMAEDLTAMTRLNAVGALYVREGNMPAVLGEIVEAAMAIAGADMGNLQLVDPRTGCLRIVAQRGFDQSYLDFWDSVTEGQGACGTALARGERQIVEDVTRSPIFAGTPALDVQLAAGVHAVQSTPLAGRSGQPIGMLSTHCKAPHRYDERTLQFLDLLAKQAADIIERAQAGEALRRSQGDLNRAQAVARVGSWRLDVRKNELTWSDENHRIFGVPKGTLMTYELFLACAHPEDRPYVHERWSAALAGEPYDIEHRIVAGGEVKWVSEKAELEFDRNGTLLGGFGTTQDVTERKLLEENLRRAKEAAQKASRVKSEFLANMSHEIRTPLSGIIGLAEVLAMRPLGPDERDILAKLQGAGRNLLEIINDILDISRIEAGRLALKPENFRPAQVFAKLTGLFEHAAEAKGLRLWTDIAPGVPEILHGDPFRLTQVLTNLLSNAIKFTPSGEVALLARPAPDDLPGTVMFSVKDTGIGIPRKKADRLFRKFKQLDSSVSKQFAGTGLGLYISKQLVKLMGGVIWIESGEGRGSTFSFTADLPQAPSQARAPAAAPAPAAREVRPLRILLAEDSKVNQMVMTFFLESVGHTVQAVETGRQALDALRRERFDLVFMDVQMPVMDGLEATRLIRQGGDLPADVPIVALTAYAMEGDRERFLAAGMDDYLSKPVELDQVQAKLRALLARKAPREADKTA
jgi:PAS domain S-box-containing protein